ncbi:MAG: hypothetical protein RJB38_1651 [Pseudomonadota bacterium]|jgi:hypothetical protein
MKQTPVIAVFGYNNTRLYDVLKIKDIAWIRHRAQILLIKSNITDADREVTPWTLDHPPEDSQIGELLERYLKENHLRLMGCLPFSDRGVIGAASAAEFFNLPGDEVKTARGMLDKALFRTFERDLNIPSDQYRKPEIHVTSEIDEIRNFLDRNGAFFIKPTSEGNSRGCKVIRSANDLSSWIEENPGILQCPVLCEELLGESGEYSFDAVAGYSWITEKSTTTGPFRAEFQHLLPAPIAEAKYLGTQRLMADLTSSLGSRGGAFHHEFFLLQDGRAASVEPNRRPAGMWIWDLAQWAFEGFDPWSAWIDHAVGARSTEGTTRALRPQAYAGVRAVIAKRDGIYRGVDESRLLSRIEVLFSDQPYRLSLLKCPGDSVRSQPRDNSDFIALVATRHPDHTMLRSRLQQAHDWISELMEVAP